jgi:DNA/RNA endonuclease YhcR with UshA esterase domain
VLVVVSEGDIVNISGEVGEYYDESEVNIGVCPSAIEIVSSGNQMPNPLIVTVGDVDTLEALEGVFVGIEGAVVDTNGLGNEIRLTDPPDTCIMGDDATWYPSYVPAMGDVIDVYGCVQYTYGSYKIEPRFPSDIVFPTTGTGEINNVAARRFGLEQNAPNPFNPVTTIKFQIPKDGHASLRVFNLSGQVVRTIVDSHMERGAYSVTWDGLDAFGRSVASGVYFYKLESEGRKATKKMVMLK